jgi:hypothetical protein
MSFTLRWWAGVCLLFALALAGACGGKDAPQGSFTDPADLSGRTVGVAALSGSATLEARYLLQERYQLGTHTGGEITLLESPGGSLGALLRDGGIDAVAADGLTAYGLLSDDEFVVLAEVTQAVRGLLGGPPIASVLVSYPDVAVQKSDALRELNRMLAESVTYLRANEARVIEAVADAQAIDPAYLRWWLDRNELAFGDLSDARRAQIQAVWQAALALGDIVAVPADDTTLGVDGAEARAAIDGDRVTVSLALLDDPGRRSALYAIEQGIVSSELVDLRVTYLPESQLGEAPAARQYDVIEATPLVVPLGAARGLDFVVVSAGLADLDGTLLFVQRSPAPRADAR